MTAATVTLGFQTSAIPGSGSGDAARRAADEVGHPRDALLDRGPGCRVAEADVLAFAGHARTEVDVREHRDAAIGEQTLAEFLGVGSADHPARLGHVRPGVE